MRKINIGFIGIALMVFVSLNCVNTDKKAILSADEQYYLDMGKSVAASTQAVLGSNLKTAMGKGGPENALEFCNAKAIPLTDSMAIVLNTAIKRVSDKARNPDNKANAFEKSIIAAQIKRLENGGEPKAQIHEVKGEMVGYYPIITNGLCLQCHGKVNQAVQQKTFDKINDFYPQDEAMGYDVNQIRGMWVVEMQKRKL